MNFFSKNKVAFWVMTILIIINIAALISFFVFREPVCETPECASGEKPGAMLRTTLGLTADQEEKVDAINELYQQTAGPISSSIKEIRESILTELETELPDTLVIRERIVELSQLQARLQHENVKQYLELKKVCTPEQAQRLSGFYRDLYGCPMKGKQMQYRHRHGQERRSN